MEDGGALIPSFFSSAGKSTGKHAFTHTSLYSFVPCHCVEGPPLRDQPCRCPAGCYDFEHLARFNNFSRNDAAPQKRWPFDFAAGNSQGFWVCATAISRRAAACVRIFGRLFG